MFSIVQWGSAQGVCEVLPSTVSATGAQVWEERLLGRQCAVGAHAVCPPLR